VDNVLARVDQSQSESETCPNSRPLFAAGIEKLKASRVQLEAEMMQPRATNVRSLQRERNVRSAGQG
jgi:hypothetical protein